MSRFPDTRISLILRLAQPADVQAWREFAEIYAPAVYAMARSRGLQAADAEDVVQELLLAVARAAGKWQPDRQRARFRTWLFAVARNLLADHFHVERQSSNSVWSLDANPQPIEVVDPRTAAVELRDEFELEVRRAAFHRAAALVRERVSETTWDAFHATAIECTPAAAVSLRLGIAVGSVYVARSRVMKLLRLEVERLQEDAVAHFETGRADTERVGTERAGEERRQSI